MLANSSKNNIYAHNTFSMHMCTNKHLTAGTVGNSYTLLKTQDYIYIPKCDLICKNPEQSRKN